MKRATLAALLALAAFLVAVSTPLYSGEHGNSTVTLAPTPDARTLLQEIRQEVSSLMDKIVNHRYVKAVEEGRVPKGHFKAFAAQQYRIVSRGLQNIALLVSRFGDQPSNEALNGFLQAEFSVIKALKKFAAALGMDEEQLLAQPAIPGALTFSTYETMICLYGTDADLITAFYFDAEVWIKNATRVGKALKEKYGFSDEAVEFFMMYANYQPQEDAVLPYLQAALDRGEPARQIKEAVYLLLAYELQFWDAMAEAAGI